MSDDVFIKSQVTPPPFYRAAVDIIIPFHNEHNLVGELISSILRTVRTNRYQLTLVDDFSESDQFIHEIEAWNKKASEKEAIRAKMPEIVCIRHDKHKGFGAAVNTGLRNTKQSWVVVLQSDVLAEANTWLSSLGECMQRLKSQGVKMICPKTNNPVVNDPVFVGSRGDHTEDVVLKEGFIPMYGFLCHRELFKRIGLLREYPYAGGEAEEFAARMRANGFQQAVCGSSWLHHEGSATLKNYAANKKVQEIL